MIGRRPLKDIVRSFYDVQDIRKKAGNRLFSQQRDFVLDIIEEGLLDVICPDLEDIGKLSLNKAQVKVIYDEAILQPEIFSDPLRKKLIDIQWVSEKGFRRHFADERAIFKDIAEEVHKHPLWEGWIQHVRGIAETLLGALMADIDISKFETPSKLRAYSGYDTMAVVKLGKKYHRWFPEEEEALIFVEHATNLELKTAEHWAKINRKKSKYDKKAQMKVYLGRCKWGPGVDYVIVGSRRIAGLPSLWNDTLKSTLWKCGQQFQKESAEKSKYRAFYEEAKAFYVARDKGRINPLMGEEYTDLHINNRALRKVAKLFLSHFWIQARKFAGLSTKQEYVIEVLGHNDYIEPYFDTEPS